MSGMDGMRGMGPGLNVPGQVQLQNQLQMADSTFYAEYGHAMVEAAEAGIESQRRWTLHHMGCEEVHDPVFGKEWVRKADAISVPSATFGLRARMFARMQEGVSHMAQLLPKDECPLPEQEMRWLANALGYEFRVSELKTNDRGVYVDASMSSEHPVARAGVDAHEYSRHRKEHPEWIDEDYRAHLGYKAVLLASARALGEAPPDPATKQRIWTGGAE